VAGRAHIALAFGVAVVAACKFDPTGLPGAGDGGGPVADAPARVDADPDQADAGASGKLAAGDVRLVYGELGSVSLHGARWRASDGAWLPDAPTVPIAGGIRWTVNAVSPTDDDAEIVVMMAEAAMGSELRALHRTDTGWEQDWVVMHPTVPPDVHAFDIAFEASGELLVVYSDGTPTPQFRTWSDETWSAPMAAPVNDLGGPNPDPNIEPVRWVELDTRPDSDEIVLAYADEGEDLVALVWDGDDWITASVFTAETELKRNGFTAAVSNRVFDAAFEADSGDVVLAWGRNGVSNFYFSVYNTGDGTWRPPAYQNNVIGGLTHFVDLESHAGTNRIAMILLDLGEGTERLALGMWNGAAWGQAQELDGQIRNVNDAVRGDFPGAVAWRGDEAVAIYPDADLEMLDWAIWTAPTGWVVQPDVPAANKGYIESVFLVSSGDSRVVAAFSDHLNALYGAVYDGQSWELSAPITDSIGSLESAPFGIAVRAD
jgi:hypothetical protein